MSQQDPLLLKLSAQLADGQRIDWKAVAGDLDPALIEQLQQIQFLADGFGTVASEHTLVVEGPGSLGDAGDTMAAGTVFGNLVIRETIGRGAYGIVYRAHDDQLDRSVALKVPSHPTLSRAELLREGQLMARIDHPNVLKVYGAVEQDGRIGFACELMQGETLERWFARQGRLGASELQALAAELCAALAALHAGGVVHGDLKPSNVLRHPAGRWVVADFGSGQFAHDSYGSSGTPMYMAPEQFNGKSSSRATDQYALGVVLFRLASGRFPYDAESTAELKASHAAGKRQRLLDLRPDLPRSLLAAVEQALATDPARRHATIGAMAQTLLDSEPVPGPSSKRWPLALAALGAVTVAAVAIRHLPPADVATLDAQWLRTTSGMDRPLQPGAVVGPGDALALQLELAQSAHVYVINEDNHGARFQLFPLAGSELSNPLPPGRIRLPGRVAGQSMDWQITSRGGRERFYLLLADRPLEDLAQLALKQASASMVDATQLLASRDPVRGVGGLAPQARREPDADEVWLDTLRQRHPSLRVERFELSNP